MIGKYIRVSSLEQKNNWFWKDIQSNKINNLIEYRFNNWDDDFKQENSKEYQDLWISWVKWDDDRPWLQELLRDIEKWIITKVIVWRLDRLARKTKLLLELIEFFDEHDVEFISTDENVDTKSPTWRFFLTILWAIWEMERSLITEKTYLWKLEAAKKWNYPFWVPPYWFKKLLWEKKLTVDDEKKKIVQKIFEMYTTWNKSLHEIARFLRSEKILQCDWKKLSNIISNKTYIWKLRVNTHKDKRDEKTWKRTLIEKPVEEHILIEVEPFIKEHIFNKAQKKLNENKYLFNNNNKPIKNHYLAWLIQCWECLSNYKAYTSRSKLWIERVYYRCNKSSWAISWKIWVCKCTNPQLSEKIILSEIYKNIEIAINKPELIEKKHLKQKNTLSNIKKYNKEINTLEFQIDNEYKTINKLYDQYNSESDERITSIITDKIENRKSSINNLKERNKTLKWYIKDEELNQDNKEVLYNFAKRLQGLTIKKLWRKELMEYLRIFIEKIVVYKDRVEIIYKFENEPTKKDIKKTTDSQNDEKSIVSAVSVMEVLFVGIVELWGKY